ncbi:MAG: acyl carrier protein [Planctomycetes bacterium]|nr:acyl carrier protein [Planctomycetota bacterium]MBM4057275.1 acyl carrier protein [Planctomycetota bacterium]
MRPDVPNAIVTAIATVLRDTGRDTRPIESGMLLAGDLGLDSLDLAQTIVLLERSLGCDPFRSASTSRSVRTVADLIAIYDSAVAPGAS